MIWADMDFEDRLQAIYLGTRDGKLAKQIAHDAATTSGVIVEFARSNGLSVRTRMPGQMQIKVRRGARRIGLLKQVVSGVSPTINTSHRHGESTGVETP